MEQTGRTARHRESRSLLCDPGQEPLSDFLRSPRANRREEEIESVFTLATDSSPEKELETKDKEQQIRQLINRLPENQRQVLRLRGIDDCSMDEIEQITGLNAVNVRVLLSRARKVIREQFEKLYEYER